MLKELETVENRIKIFDVDENGREINIYHLNNCVFLGDLYYPNPVAWSNNNLYRVIRETTMSLSSVEGKSLVSPPSGNETYNLVNNPVFFFVYNTDNYYHFIYDTLPYLISYKFMKNKISNLKLLMNYPNHGMDTFYKFVSEFLEILEIYEDDILMINSSSKYSDVYVSSSYTHDFKSNLPPRKEVYELYETIKKKVSDQSDITKLPKKIYISRRTWTNRSDITNIGTNYTTRRRLVNEDQVVEILEKGGYVEIFTENLTTKQKISLFKNAESVVGAIGGGMCNVLFCNKKTNVFVIVSPSFLDINSRFRFSLDCCKTYYLDNSSHKESGYWKQFMRVMVKNSGIIGEILEISKENLKISFTTKPVSGWNSLSEFETEWFPKEECLRLDDGLNSAWEINLEKIKEIL